MGGLQALRRRPCFPVDAPRRRRASRPCSHHICLEVEDIAASMAHVGARVRLLDGRARIGAHGLPVVFAHPKDMCGVLTELEEVERK